MPRLRDWVVGDLDLDLDLDPDSDPCMDDLEAVRDLDLAEASRSEPCCTMSATPARCNVAAYLFSAVRRAFS